MSKSFINTLNIIVTIITIIYCILALTLIPSILFGFGMGGNLSNIESIKLFLYLLFFVFVLYVPVKMWHLQDNRKIVTLFILYVIIATIFHLLVVNL